MLIDFPSLQTDGMQMLELSQRFSLHDLRLAVNSYVDTTLDLIADAGDAVVTFEPIDRAASDPYAKPGEETIAWNFAHLVLHVTASLEEGAAFSSLLARSVVLPEGIRLRYEPDWKTVTTREQVIMRLEECRRMCLAYLETWPNEPHLNTFRPLSERGRQLFGDLNAPASLLLGLRHWHDHLDQMRDALAQAKAAAASV